MTVDVYLHDSWCPHCKDLRRWKECCAQVFCACRSVYIERKRELLRTELLRATEKGRMTANDNESAPSAADRTRSHF